MRRAPIALCLAVMACGHDRGNGPSAAQSIALTTNGGSPLAIGQTMTVYAHASDANGTRIPRFTGVTWQSSNPTVASIAKADTAATVTGLAVGETVISATVRTGVVAQLTVRVGSVPVINASPSTATFTGYRGVAVNPQTIAITNAGAGQLSSLTATTTAAWLQASFVDGVTSANPTASLRLQPSTSGLADGSYTTTVTVSSGVAGVSPRAIPVTFQVAAAPVAFKIEASSPPFQTGSAGQPVAAPPAVIVRAADNTPVPGVTVTFAVTGGGSIAPSGAVVTNGSGVAALTSWTLGAQPGAAQTVTVSAPGLAGSPVTFTANALSASKIVKVSGDNQSSVVARALPQPIVVRVSDPNDGPVPNATVTFAAGSGGSVTPTTATTDATGQATATWTLGSTRGTQTLGATLVGPQGSPTVTFTATATGATTITKVGGDGQQAFAGSELPQPIRVRVTGVNDLPVAGVTVTFAPSGGGAASPATAPTDANGEASTRWTLPPVVGGATLVASVPTESGTASVGFSATGTTPPAGGVVITAGDNQSGRTSTALPQQIVARVVTTIGTPVSGASVTFTPASGAGSSFSPASGVSDGNGEVRTTWTLGPGLGTYTATVSSPGLPTRTITASATLPPPNASMFTGAATKVPTGGPPTAPDQAVLAYAGPASGEVPLAADGSFATAALPPGTYTLSVVSKSGAFPTTAYYGAVGTAGQITSVGTIPIAYPGVATLVSGVHACPLVGDNGGTAVVRFYAGINGDQSGAGAIASWTTNFGVTNSTSMNYGIYTMTITTQATDPGKTCAPYRATITHSATTSNVQTVIPLITLSNP